ncbi:plasmid mobilization protein [Pseudomonas fulva]|uniref:plasmid mobilization protein n=1 Tax=Pseudomonas TaxID=286 RepID=UPI00384B808D
MKLRDTRKHGKHLRVPVLPSEELTIKENASKASLTVAEYLRRLSLGYEITSTLASARTPHGRPSSFSIPKIKSAPCASTNITSLKTRCAPHGTNVLTSAFHSSSNS